MKPEQGTVDFQRLKPLVEKTLGIADLKVDSSFLDHIEWDSMGHVSLMAAIQFMLG